MSNSRRKKNIFQRYLFPIAALLALLFCLFVINWTFVSSDISESMKNNQVNRNDDLVETVAVSTTSRSSYNAGSSDITSNLDLTKDRETYSPLMSSISINKNNNKEGSHQNIVIGEPVDQDSLDYILKKMSEGKFSLPQMSEIPSENHKLLRSAVVSEVPISTNTIIKENSCSGTPLEKSLALSTIFRVTDFDCSISNDGWMDHIPAASTNSSRSIRLHQWRVNFLAEFSLFQNGYDFDDKTGKYIVFWPLFAGIGNNLAVLTEVVLIAMKSKRKLLIYDWVTLRDYFYFPFKYEVITRKVWEDDTSTLIVNRTNICPFDSVDVCHGEVNTRFIVMRSTCLTTQRLIRVRDDRLWLTGHGILPKSLSGPQEMTHHVYRFLYREMMVPRQWVQDQIDAFKTSTNWDKKYIIGIHIRTGGVKKESFSWGRFINEKDVILYHKYAQKLTNMYLDNNSLVAKDLKKTNDYDSFKRKKSLKYPISWYVLSDQESIRNKFETRFPDNVISTKCDMSHTNRAREVKADAGFTCAIIENYLLSSSDILILTARSTYGYLARHRTNAPVISIDVGDYERFTDDRDEPIIDRWIVNDI